MNLLSRLIYGCGRLTGGASRRESRDLLNTVFDAGIQAIDLAPSYGLGTAEAVAGDVLSKRSDRDQITVITKVGSARPSHGEAKSWLRAMKRAFIENKPRTLAEWTPPIAQRDYGAGDFGALAMEQSLEISRGLLPKIDKLLLHGCGPDQCTPEVSNCLHRLCAVIAAQPGYGIGGPFDPGFDAGYPAGFWASAAIDPEVFAGRKPAFRRHDLSLHSIVQCGTYLFRTDPSFAAQISSLCLRLPVADQDTARIAAYYFVAAEREPTAQLIFSSNDAGRLKRTLAALAATDQIETRGFGRQ